MRLKHEVLHAAAGLKQYPMFVFTLVFTLALTLGALIAAFNLNNVIMFKELPYQNTEQLYILDQEIKREGNHRRGKQHIDAQVQMYKTSKEFLPSALLLRGQGILASSDSEPRLNSLHVTYEFFEILSVPFEIGSGFSKSADMSSAPPEAVISYDTWQHYFFGREDIIGQSMEFERMQFKVVGVLKKDFKEPLLFHPDASDIYIPAAYSQLNSVNGGAATTNLLTLVQIVPGNNVEQMGSRLTSIFDDFIKTGSEAHLYKDAELDARLILLEENIKGNSGTITIMILAGAFVLLLIAFVNVTNLYLSHLNKKQQTLAICACLGAKPKLIFKRLFVESLVLTLSSTLFAILLATWLLTFIKEFAYGTLPRLSELGLDLPTVIFSVVIALLLAALLAFCGRFTVNYDALKEQLNSSGKGTSAQVSPRVRQVLIVSQTALTGLLIVASSMVLQLSLATANHPLGIDVENVISVEVDAEKNYTTEAQKKTLATEIRKRFSQLPQVAQIANTRISPIMQGHYGTFVYDESKKMIGGFLYNRVDENFMDIVQLPLLHGRNFSREEVVDHENVVILSKSMAQTIFGETDVVERRIYNSTGQAFTVVGVVGDYFSVSNGEPYFYFTYKASDINLLIKLKDQSSLSKLDILQQLRTIDPSLRIQQYLVLEQTARDLVYQYRLSAWLAGGLSLFALILACTGIYGVISYSTQMRRYEMGVRMALGAKKKRIIAMVLKDAMNPILIGLGISLLLSIVLYGLANSQVSGLIQPDAVQVGASLVLLLVFSLLACYLPVNNIVRSDPIKALRNE